MKEIKFRVWDKLNKKMCTVMEIKWFKTNHDLYDLQVETSDELIDVDFELMQYTGLNDKNGRAIYEGDIIVRGEKYPEIVTYNDGDWTLDYSYSDNRPVGSLYCNLGFYVTERRECEIIGNIYQNPELLKILNK